MSEIKPALTPEEWAERSVAAGDSRKESYCTVVVRGRKVFMDAGDARDYYGQGEGEVARPEAVAALCLNGQPFGFTWEDVRRHREEARAIGEKLGSIAMRSQHQAVAMGSALEQQMSRTFRSSVPDLRARKAWHESMADRIAALLPPEESRG